MVKIALVTDYFYPFTPGGAEWSVYDLAKSLKVRGVESSVITINYGAKSNESFNGLNIVRIPFLKKLNKNRSVVNPIWQNNPFFFITSAISLNKLIRLERIDLIHVNGKFLIPAAIIVGFLSKKPVLVTIRDKQILCPIGKCFFNSNRHKRCGFFEYLTSDIPWFIKNYVSNNPIHIIYALLGVIWSRIAGDIMKAFAKHAIVITTISNSQKKYLQANGFRDVKVIYNTTRFSSPRTSQSKSKSVLFVGKLSKGKGIELLLDASEKVLKKLKVNFIFAGEVHSDKLEARLKKSDLQSKVKILGSVDHTKLPYLYRRSSCLVMPSIYPESFGRSALESLAAGTPVVATNIGPSSEIVEDKILGRISEANSEKLGSAILDVLSNEQAYRNNIKKNYESLKQKFSSRPIEQYVKLYRSQL